MHKLAEEYKLIVSHYTNDGRVKVATLFGKPCLKVNGKAFIALHNNFIVFKLKGKIFREANSLDGSELWDPSGKGHPMKEWVAVNSGSSSDYLRFASAALAYVSSAL
jgi:hypothetical protein